MKILALNCGSSSVKFQLFDADRVLAKGSFDGLRPPSSKMRIEYANGEIDERVSEICTHYQAVEYVLHSVAPKDLDGVGHRVVHAGEYYSESVLIDDEVAARIEECGALAPLHNPPNLRGYEAVKAVEPRLPNVAVFDTAFHQTVPKRAFLFGLPYELYSKHRIRRYGFHGTSHRYVSLRFAEIKQKPPEELKVIVSHLGNGSSLCAVDRGRSIETSMGFTPLDGLMMGTRPGQLDPGVLLHLMSAQGATADELTQMLNHKSGLLGVSGLSNDMRTLVEAAEKGNERATLAIDVFCYRVKKYIGSLYGVLNGADALLFTGGIGENQPLIRERSCEALDALGITVDRVRNQAARGCEARISSDGGRTEVWVVPTNEELLIARETVRLISRHT